MTGLLRLTGVRPRDKAHWLASQLSIGHQPVTALFKQEFGIDLHPAPECSGERRLHDGEAELLDAPAGTPCYWRSGRLLAGDGEVAASAFLLWLPHLLPAETCAALAAAIEPAGTVLGRLPGGMQREKMRAVAASWLDEVTGRFRCVETQAALAVGGVLVGYVEEGFVREFVEALP